ncbi:Hsp70 family protein [Amycolatopsis sp. WAC 01376]|uniref:Hsp70 family protein n=1 Tax=Amycolatopsis sp. WAC 01376 TaxID=2203195 RepID=UPI003519B445
MQGARNGESGRHRSRCTNSSAKRFIGRRYDEVTYDVVPGLDAGPFDVYRKSYAPEEVSALVLRKLVEDASKFLGE